MSERDDWGAMAGADEFDEEFLGPRRSNIIFFAVHVILSGAIWWWASQWAPQAVEPHVRWITLGVAAVGFLLALGYWLASMSRKSYYLKTQKVNLSDDDRRVGAMRMSWRAYGLARYMGVCLIWAAPWLATAHAQDLDLVIDWFAHFFVF